MVVVFLVLLVCPQVRAGEEDPLRALRESDLRCDPERRFCLGIELHVAVKESGPVRSADWVLAQVRKADALFALIDVSFQLSGVHALPADRARMVSRKDRDLLGRKRHTVGVIHVFVVEYLANVDDPGEIYGVHWRDRDNTSRRWIILSAISWGFTLAHELGHFFGLPHCNHRGSIMNKTGRDKTPMSERGFVPQEVKRMKKRLRRMLRKKYLLPVVGPPAGSGRGCVGWLCGSPGPDPRPAQLPGHRGGA